MGKLNPREMEAERRHPNGKLLTWEFLWVQIHCRSNCSNFILHFPCKWVCFWDFSSWTLWTLTCSSTVVKDSDTFSSFPLGPIYHARSKDPIFWISFFFALFERRDRKTWEWELAFLFSPWAESRKVRMAMSSVPA